MTSRQTAVPAREPAPGGPGTPSPGHPGPGPGWCAGRPGPGPAVADRRPMRRARTDTAAGYVRPSCPAAGRRSAAALRMGVRSRSAAIDVSPGGSFRGSPTPRRARTSRGYSVQPRSSWAMAEWPRTRASTTRSRAPRKPPRPPASASGARRFSGRPSGAEDRGVRWRSRAASCTRPRPAAGPCAARVQRPAGPCAARVQRPAGPCAARVQRPAGPCAARVQRPAAYPCTPRGLAAA